MRRLLAILLIASLGGMPLMSLARAVSADVQQMQETQEAQAMKDMPCHQSAPKPADQSQDDCGYCKGASHCCAGFLPPASAFRPAVETGVARIASPPVLAAGIVIPPLDPPPLVL